MMLHCGVWTESRESFQKLTLTVETHISDLGANLAGFANTEYHSLNVLFFSHFMWRHTRTLAQALNYVPLLAHTHTHILLMAV